MIFHSVTATIEILDDGKHARRTRTTRHLRRKYQFSDSERNESSKPQIVAKNPWVIFSDDEDEDALPASTTSESKSILKNAVLEDNSYMKTTENGMKAEPKDDGRQGACLKRKLHAVNQNGKCDRFEFAMSIPLVPLTLLWVFVSCLSVFVSVNCVPFDSCNQGS